MNQRQLAELVEVDSGPMGRRYADYGVKLQISDHGQYWQFRRFERGRLVAFAEWWPTTNRLVLNRAYDKPKHPADVRVAEKILEQFFGIPAPIPVEPDGWARTAGWIE